eukprot:10778556-Heterocapsa_arctica.AAC.1
MPEWHDDLTLHQFMEQLLSWEPRVVQYEAATGAPMPDNYRPQVSGGHEEGAEGHSRLRQVEACGPHVPHPWADLRLRWSCGARRRRALGD